MKAYILFGRQRRSGVSMKLLAYAYSEEHAIQLAGECGYEAAQVRLAVRASDFEGAVQINDKP